MSIDRPCRVRASVVALAIVARSLPVAPAQAQPPTPDPFAADIRATPWLSPEDERAKLHVPDGFTIHCFAHEPDLYKPMNMAFDARGRLWCTSSTEYPYPVKGDKNFVGRDKITIFEDTDGDGVADKVTVFADGLNIPIGLYPCVDPNGHDGCIVFSLPYIWRFHDDDGDGVADRREILYGPMGWERDTHGLNNAFRRGFDGWVYANHGYNNRTTVKGKDGHEVHMESGNTYRFRMDGSRIEQWTQGQVNPFGSSFDERGDLYTADCHTLPITLIVRGGCYDSFGRPHDGLGYAPTLMSHLHGSTALCGLAIPTDESWPDPYRNDLYCGNVMTCRVHRDKLVYDGSTPHAVEQPDLVVSDDPWFRPVDLQIGFDGAMYVADFYNRIIGHYEVPLDHPGRDRTSGRIWRIAPTTKHTENGEPSHAKTSIPNLRAATPSELERELGNPNLTIRMRSLDELTDRFKWDEVWKDLSDLNRHDGDQRKAMILHARERFGHTDMLSLGVQTPEGKIGLQAELGVPAVRLALMQIAADPRFDVASPSTTVHPYSALICGRLADPDPFVQRAAAQALGQHPAFAHVAPLLALLHGAPSKDLLLRHVARIALRNQLAIPSVFEPVAKQTWSAEDLQLLVEVARAVDGEVAARFVVAHLDAWSGSRERAQDLLEHAARESAPADLPQLVECVKRRFTGERETQLTMLEAIVGGLDRRGVAPDASISNWAGELVRVALDSPDALAPKWRDAPVAGQGKSDDPWCLQVRRCADGVDAPLLSSLPRGEKLTGVLRSPPFKAPARLSFFLAGHNGELDREAIPFNRVRVRAASDAGHGEAWADVLAPRNDVAQKVELDLAAHADELAVVELVDANPYDAYAWLAAGRFEPPVVTLPARAPAEVSGETLASLRLAARFKEADLGPSLLALTSARSAEPAVRAAAAVALLARTPSPLGSALATSIDDPDSPAELVEPVCAAIASHDEPKLAELAARVLEIAPARMHAAVALALAKTASGASRLLELVKVGKAAPSLLARPELKDAVVAALAKTTPDAAARIADLTKNLPSDDVARARVISDRRRSYARYGGDAKSGAHVFSKHCAVCHSIGGVGAKIGPQLDGISSRGFERLYEDVLDPSRNVDVQFRRTNLFTTDGDVLSVLLRRTEGATLVYADEQGKEHELPKSQVARQSESRLSLMPGNFDEVLDDATMRDLIAYLMTPATPAPPPPAPANTH